jgi:hypothetical protein
MKGIDFWIHIWYYSSIESKEDAMASDALQKVIRKIKRCLAKATSRNNPNEAAVALEMARRLMKKYNLNDADLESQTIEDIIEVDMIIAMRDSEPSLLLVVWLGKAFHVTPIQMRVTKTGSKRVIKCAIRFIGTKADVAVSTFIFSYMMSILEVKAADYFQTVRKSKEAWTITETNKVKEGFSLGFVAAVVEKLKAIEAHNASVEASRAAEHAQCLSIGTMALVVIKHDLIKRYMDEAHPNAEETQGDPIKCNSSDYGAGYIEGEKTGIYRGVGKNKDRTAIKGDAHV